MLKLLRFLKEYKIQVIFGPVFKLIEAIFELIVPLVMARIIDVGIKNGDTSYVLRMGGVMILLGVVGLASSLTCQRFAAIASQGFGTAVRKEVFSHINAFSHSELDKFGTSSLIIRIINDVNQLQLAVAMLIRLVVRAPFLAVGAIIMAVSIDAKLSVIFLAVTPLIALILYIIMSKSVKFYRLIQKKLDKISLITRENLSGARVIKAFSKQEMEKERFYDASADLAETAVKVGKLSALLNPLTFIVMNFGIIAVLWFGGIRVESGTVSQGEIIAFVNYMTQILLALIVVANLVALFTKASASAVRINEIFETKSSVLENDVAAEPIISEKKVEFKNVTFSYGNGESALKNITFTVLSGETIGIIGGTGSGKTTLVNLIPRFYDVTDGEVIVNGINVKDYSVSELRGNIGVAPQKAVLFNASIRDNIKWGKFGATDEEIKKALDISQSSEFVEKMPEKYDTIISQGSKNLSGGQKQRLTIARALVSKPQILILDDSASALDYVTDTALRRELAENLTETTVFFITQRVAGVKQADKIIVLDDGEIVGMGTHAELFEACDEYRKICASQEVEK